MKTGTTEKVKFKALKRLLKLNTWGAVGVLESLWAATYANAPDGAIGRLSNNDIAAAIDWSGNADELVEALVATHWLDPDPVDGRFRLVVHDWSEHCSNGLKSSFLRYQKQFADVVMRDGDTKRGVPTQHHAAYPRSNLQRTHAAPYAAPCSVPTQHPTQQPALARAIPDHTNTNNLTIPKDQTVPDHTSPTKPRALSADADFERFWNIFPSRRKTHKDKAREAWAKAIKRTDAETIIAAAEEFSRSDKGRGEYCPMPSTWLNGGCWNDDRAAWRERGNQDPRGNVATVRNYINDLEAEEAGDGPQLED